MEVVHGVYAPPRCPASDESGRCTGRADTPACLKTCFGTEVIVKLCAFHADVLEAVYS